MFAGLNCVLCRGKGVGGGGGWGVVGGQTAADNHLTFSDRLTGAIFSVAMAAICELMAQCVTKVADGR